MAKKFPSPFSTGGGGTRFEWLVATSYLVALLKGEKARGLPIPGTVIEVRFQQKPMGYAVDDIVVFTALGTRHAKLALQVKHSIRFTTNDLFCGTMATCWKHFTSQTFDEKRDFVGIAIGEVCNTNKIRTHGQEVLEWARTSTGPQSFYARVQKIKSKQHFLDLFYKSLVTGLGRGVSKTLLWRFLRCFVIIPFDFDHPGGRDTTDCWNRLQGLVPRRHVRHAKTLFDALYGLASRHSKAGGEIDFDTLRRELPELLPLFIVPNVRTVQAALVQQVRRQLEREKKSKKYIPDVFTEIHTVKESGRFFSHPSLFYQKAIESIQRIDTSFLDRLLCRLHLPPTKLGLPQGLKVCHDISRIPSQCTRLLSHFKKIIQTLYDDYYPKVSEKFEKMVPIETRYIFDEAQYLLRAAGGAVCWYLESINKELCEVKSRILLLTSRAGQGKTNFICDFAENFLLLRGLPCLLVTGREFRNVPVGNLDAHIVRLVMGTSFDGTIEDFLKLVGEVCAEGNTPFTIIFDGINEHSQITAFAAELERLIERLVDFRFVKIILTCRSEYFTERFSNLQQSSFGDEIYAVHEIQRDMSAQHRRQMESAYFKFFKIRPGYMSGKVREALRADPLLLRFFCEAYGDPQARKPVRLPSMPDIYRDAVFRLYVEKKLKEISERQESGPSAGIQLHRAYKELLRELVSIMTERRIFSDIPVSCLEARHYPALSELIAEDVFVRKDIVQGKSVLDTDAEVINFTFDEFRDYLLADHLIQVTLKKTSSTEDFAKQIGELTEKTCPVAEGVSRYLFYAAKRFGDEALLGTIKAMPWYDKVFLDCIFSIEDNYLTEDDIRKVHDAFMRSNWAAGEIVFALMVRWDTDATPRLNINLLFEILDSLGDEQYNGLIRPLFEKRLDPYGLGSKPPYEIGRLVSDIKYLVGADRGKWEPKYKKIAEFLIYLFPIEGESYTFPAFDLFRQFAHKHPERAVSLLAGHINIQLSAVKVHVWEMLAELAGKGFIMPRSLIQEGVSRLTEGIKSTPREMAEIRRFVTSCQEKITGDI